MGYGFLAAPAVQSVKTPTHPYTPRLQQALSQWDQQPWREADHLQTDVVKISATPPNSQTTSRPTKGIYDDINVILIRHYGTTTLITTHPFYRGADKSLARPGRKQATTLRIHSTYSPRSSIHFLARCSNFWKPIKKTFQNMSAQPCLSGSND